jgi:hypothetical protein
MIRCTARSVIPTRTATSRRTVEGFFESTISTWAWLVRNVHRASDFDGTAAAGLAAVGRASCGKG